MYIINQFKKKKKRKKTEVSEILHTVSQTNYMLFYLILVTRWLLIVPQPAFLLLLIYQLKS